MASPRHPQTTNVRDGVLPPDVLFEVLLRLPAIMLLGHPRAVYRSWRSLLSDPLFLSACHPGRRLLAVSAHADVELPGTPSAGRVVRRVPRSAGPFHPWNPPNRIHLGLVLVGRSWKCQRLRVVDAATGAVSVLPEPDRRRNLLRSRPGRRRRRLHGWRERR
ncbi:unnamed protein product [Urochloa humidicola]